jgi:hypothetical protein
VGPEVSGPDRRASIGLGSVSQMRYRRQRVTEYDLGAVWDPGVPGATLTVPDDGAARLRLRHRRDDKDTRDVVLVWNRCLLTRTEPMNDESLDCHRLYDAGLCDVVWIGRVHGSKLVQEVARCTAASSETLTHWVVPLKEFTVEAVAESLLLVREDPDSSIGL